MATKRPAKKAPAEKYPEETYPTLDVADAPVIEPELWGGFPITPNADPYVP